MIYLKDDITLGELKVFFETMKDADVEEFEALMGHSLFNMPASYLLDQTSVVVGKAKDQEHVLGLGGVNPEGVIWFIPTTKLPWFSTEFLRFSKRYLKELLAIYPRLYNLAYLKNETHIRWLKWLGATWQATRGDFQSFEFTRKEETDCGDGD